MFLDAVITGGGPAGSVVARLLASWGHRVRILTKAGDPARGLGESLPPSTEKLLATVGVLDAVEHAGFYRATGNTVWWASREPRVEKFGPGSRALGYQVHRPAFDRVLLEQAALAGAEVHADSLVRGVWFADDHMARVESECRGRRSTVSCQFVLDCSGRTGIIGRRFRAAESRYRTCALVGVWQTNDRWDLPDETHTIVETYDDGWSWSVPIARSTRHVGLMVDGTSPRSASRRTLAKTYLAEVARTAELRRILATASLERVWACDASLYCSRTFAGSRFLLVGDAGSFIDPLSSFGVKKALASAWLAAIVVHTCLVHPECQTVALDFFSNREREMYSTYLGRSRDFARAAVGRHPHAFWTTRAEVAIDEPENGQERTDFGRDPDVQAAFERFKRARSIDLTLAERAQVEKRPVIRDREIVLEDAWLLSHASARTSASRPIRFVGNVDLMTLAHLAPQHRQMPELFDAYCRTCAPAPLPSVVSGLSLLVARGILHERS